MNDCWDVFHPMMMYTFIVHCYLVNFCIHHATLFVMKTQRSANRRHFQSPREPLRSQFSSTLNNVYEPSNVIAMRIAIE